MKQKTMVQRQCEKVNFENELENFLREKEAEGTASQTLKGYKYTLGKFLKFYKTRGYGVLDQGVLYDFINDMRTRTDNTSTINHDLRTIRVFVYWLQERDLVKQFRIKSLKGQELPPKCHTEDELERLLQHPDKQDDFLTWRNWAMVSFVLGTGCRAGSIVNIQMQDLDIANSQVILRHTKNKKPQIIPLSISLKSALQQYISIWRYGTEKQQLLFPTVGETALTSHSLRNGYLRYCRDRQVENTSIHHTYSALDTREISLTGYIIEDVEANKRQLLRLVTPLRPFELLVDDKKIVCYANTTPQFTYAYPEFNKSIVKFMIEAYCPQPCFTNLNKTVANLALWNGNFSFPLELSASGIAMGTKTVSTIADIENNGDIETGMIVEFTAKSSLKNPSILNVNTQEFIRIHKPLLYKEFWLLTIPL